MAGQGRYSTYTPEIGDRICNLISTTTLGTNKLCDLHDWLPNESTIYEWRLVHDDFSKNYAKAKSYQAALMAEKLHELCEVGTFEDKDGITRADAGMVAIQRLKVDTTKWYASKLAPKIYGDKQVIENITTENDALKKELADLRAKLLEQSKSEY
ncbi:MAG: hypothetical protein A3F67_02535 [Verrucomicrobia bacterium RIFCSPHIGHO2_12_FULL_41_10]|nr:MAG: hypothetical protein A3F67_02535 [Verrucomicrobia bacterium RIFCSPHIGHO2_12_FULL_41_10]